MALILDDQQAMLHESVNDFLSREAPVSHLRELRNQRSADGISRTLWREFAYLGYAGALLSEEHGGSSLGHGEISVIMEAIGRHLTPSPFWSTAVVGATALRLGGSVTQRSVHMPAIGAGNAILALALEERGKHDPAATRLTATAEGTSFILNGAKTFVVNGHIANTLLVLARTAGLPGETAGLTLLMVDPNTAGVGLERTIMVDSHNAARISFTNVKVPAHATLGAVGRAWELLEPVLDAGRIAAAAELIGIADEAFRRTVEFLKERVQFGRRIGEFQALQHRAARLHVQLELARASVLMATRALDDGDSKASLLVSVAKAKAGVVATQAVQEAAQMHGGMGMSDEVDIGLFMKRAKVLEELLGDHRYHADRVAVFNGY